MVDGSTASDVASPEEEELPPQGNVKVVYLGPVAPHWEVHDVLGDRALIDAFRQRVIARLQLLPPHDPQFHRNRARVDRDAERERLVIEWDLGFDEPSATRAHPPATESTAPTPDESPAEESPAEESPSDESPADAPAADDTSTDEPPADAGEPATA